MDSGDSSEIQSLDNIQPKQRVEPEMNEEENSALCTTFHSNLWLQRLTSIVGHVFHCLFGLIPHPLPLGYLQSMMLLLCQQNIGYHQKREVMMKPVPREHNPDFYEMDVQFQHNNICFAWA